jgi:hypothetical protein
MEPYRRIFARYDAAVRRMHENIFRKRRELGL